MTTTTANEANTCSYCDRPSMLTRHYSGERLCGVCLCKTLEKRIRRTVRRHQMFSPQTSLVLGVSGGKDSAAIVHNVALLQRRHPRPAPMYAIHIDEGIGDRGSEAERCVRAVCEAAGIPLLLTSFEAALGKSLEGILVAAAEVGYEYNACTLCASFKRRALNDAARWLGAARIVVGHNLDDTAQMVLLNVVRADVRKMGQTPPWGNISPADSPLDSTGLMIPRVKPLMYIPEEEIAAYATFKQWPIVQGPCPKKVEYPIWRKQVQTFLDGMETQSPEIKYNVVKAGETLYQRLNEHSCEPVSPKPCVKCGQPAGPRRQTCLFCEFVERLDLRYELEQQVKSWSCA